MSDPLVNCVVDVQFDEGAARFSYSCYGSSRGWQVYSDGGIYPPMLGRVVQFRMQGSPDIKIAGFQISADELAALQPSHRWTALPNGNPGVTPISPSPSSYPAADGSETFSELTLDIGVQRWFYRLAILVNNELIWDDPKIHDDGSE